jgi:predicted transcriptional regulator
VLWEHSPANVSLVLERVNEARPADQQIAYTTAMTVLARLHDKRILARRKRGRGYSYEPRFDEAALIERLSQQEVERLVDRFGPVALAHFAVAIEDADRRFSLGCAIRRTMMTDRRLALFGFAIGVAGYCAAGFTTGHHLKFARTAIAVAVGAALARVRAGLARRARSARRLRAMSRPTKIADVPVRTGTFRHGAFVAGVLRPRIYCDERLAAELPPDQLRGVMLHELAHQRARDPLRLVLLEVVAPLLRPFPTGRAWLAWATAQPEIRADEHALAHGVSRSNLAAALLAMGRHGRPHLAGFVTAIDLRLQVLLGEPAELDVGRRAIGMTIMFVGAAAGTATCAWFLHTVIATAAATIL